VKPASLFTDNMVLQREMKVPVWGTAAPGEKVVVTMGEQRGEAVADKDGKWTVKIGPMGAGGPFEMVIAGTNTITLSNVLVGEVWVCGGQSNMAWPLASAKNGREEAAKANYPAMRQFRVGVSSVDEAQSECKGCWEECRGVGVGSWTAVGYYFGREIHEDLKVPVGLINLSVGGTMAQAWTRREAMESDAELKGILTTWEKSVADFPATKQKYEEDMATWKEAAEKAKAEGKPEPRKPFLADPHALACFPAGLYNGMVAPTAGYGIRGTIWYQGESNVYMAYLYRKLLPALIADWRAAWGQGEFPFLIVQLSDSGEVKSEPSSSGWADLREAQLLTWKTVANTGMAVTFDVGNASALPPTDHPTNKLEVGKRLSLAARGLVYGEKIEYSGPIYESMKVEGDKVRLTFQHAGSGLEAKGGEPGHFAIAGADKKFVWAKAKIEGDEVVVWSEAVTAPVAVRYAWANNPAGANLYNKEGLPASPFRTDDWPGVSWPRK